MTRRLLFITSTPIGDSILSTGVLDALVTAEPDLAVTVACGPLPAQLFEATPNLERLIVVHKRKRAGHWRDLWKQTVGTRWHRVVDMRRSALPWLLRAKHRHLLPADKPVHRVFLNAEAIGRGAMPPAPVVWTRPQDHAEAARLLAGEGPLLGLGPAATWPGKTWPIEKWIDLVPRLVGPDGVLPGARVVLFGAPNERTVIEPLRQSLPADRVIDLVGGPHLLTVAAALKKLDLFVGNDSALMHMAAAVGAPTLGLFGPTDDRRYAPWGRRAAIVRTPETWEDWYLHMQDPDFHVSTCGSLMGSLPVEAVEAGARALLARRDDQPS